MLDSQNLVLLQGDILILLADGNIYASTKKMDCWLERWRETAVKIKKTNLLTLRGVSHVISDD